MMTIGLSRRPARLRVDLAVVALASSLVVPLGLASSGPALAQAPRPDVCPEVIGGLSFLGGSASDDARGSNLILCSYSGETDGLRDSASVQVGWVSRGGATNDVFELEIYCDTDPGAVETRQMRASWADGTDYSRVGERYLQAFWGATREPTVALAGELARSIVDSLEPTVEQCPGATGRISDPGPEPADGEPVDDADESEPRLVTVTLSGDRLAAMRAQGGVGAIVPLVGDEQWEVVASATDGADAIREGFLGTIGRVISIDVEASDADGDALATVTVEVIDDEGDSDAGADPSVTDPDRSPGPVGDGQPDVAFEPDGEQEAGAEPSVEPEPEPAVVPEATATPDTRSEPADVPDPIMTPGPIPAPTAGSTAPDEAGGGPAADPGPTSDGSTDLASSVRTEVERRVDSLFADIEPSLDELRRKARRRGGVVSVRIPPNVVRRNLRHPQVSEVTLAPQGISVKVALFEPRLALTVDRGLGRLFYSLDTNLPAWATAIATEALDEAIPRFNAAVRERGLRLNEVRITRNGIVLRGRLAGGG